MKRIVLSILLCRCALFWLPNLNSVQLKSIPIDSESRPKRDAQLYQLLRNTFGVSEDIKNAAISIPCSVESYEDYSPLFTDICESENCCDGLEKIVPNNDKISQEISKTRKADNSKTIMNNNITESPVTEKMYAPKMRNDFAQNPQNESNLPEAQVLSEANNLNEENSMERSKKLNNSNRLTTKNADPRNDNLKNAQSKIHSNTTNPIFITMSKQEHPCKVYFLDQLNNTNEAKEKTPEKKNKTAKVPDPPKILIEGQTEQNMISLAITTEPNLEFTEDFNRSSTPNIVERNLSTTTENGLKSTANSTTTKNTLTQTSTTSKPLKTRKRNSTKTMSAAASTKIEDSDVLDTNLCGNFCQLEDAVYPERNPKKIIKSYLEPIAFETDLMDPYKKQQRQNSQDYFIDESQIFRAPEAMLEVRTPPSFHINNILRGFSRKQPNINWRAPLFGTGRANLNYLQPDIARESNENLKFNCIEPNICQSNEDILSFKTNNDIQRYRPANFRGYFT